MKPAESQPGGDVPRVSVLTACYNAAEFLEDCLDSVRAQTLQDYEHIVVDDGSTDDSWRILRERAVRDPRLIVLQRPNGGPAAARNTGLERAAAPWVAVLDADDMAAPSRLARQLAAAESAPDIVLVGSDCIEVDRRGAELARHGYPATHGTLLRHVERSMRFVPHSSFFYARAAAVALGGYRTPLSLSEDVDLALRLSGSGRLISVPEPLIRLRRHGDSVSHVEGGRRQHLVGLAARVSHFRRLAGLPDPVDQGEAEWQRYFAWIDARMEVGGEWAMSRRWLEVRSASAEGGSTHRIALALKALRRPGMLVQRLRMRWFGSSYARKLARAYPD